MNNLSIENTWEKYTLNNNISLLSTFCKNKNKLDIIFDFTSLKKIDSSGMILIIKYINILEQQSCKVVIKNISLKHKKMLDFYTKNYVNIEFKKDNRNNIFYSTTKYFVDFFKNFLSFLYFFGRLSFYMFYSILHPSKIRFRSILFHIEVAGFKILPIIAITMVLISFVTAYQGALQLESFGVPLIVVEMTTMSMFREFAPFIAAVIIAGRSASSYTAQLGAMKITDEIDAMRTMGFSPDMYLIIPRVFALIIVMPLIVFFADMLCLVGEMLLAKFYLDMSFSEFFTRVYNYVEVRHFLLGLFKAPLFGFVIAIIGCFRGLQVRGSTDSIGLYTTKSVVDSILWLIILNSIISYLSITIGF
ncbi:MAG: ABC transporter permease [Campylobacterales bacterium]|nr:ABC transporter permease [Campylobacterales bacterium]